LHYLRMAACRSATGLQQLAAARQSVGR